jgi:hypothetical protein
MMARLGNVIYWIACGLAVLVFLYFLRAFGFDDGSSGQSSGVHRCGDSRPHRLGHRPSDPIHLRRNVAHRNVLDLQPPGSRRAVSYFIACRVFPAGYR